MAVNVEQLRRAIADLPGDMPVVTQQEHGWDSDTGLYLMAAHVEHHAYGDVIGEGAARNSADWPWRQTDCRALLISGYGQIDDDAVDITPDSDRPTVVDAEPATSAIALPGPQP